MLPFYREIFNKSTDYNSAVELFKTALERIVGEARAAEKFEAKDIPFTPFDLCVEILNKMDAISNRLLNTKIAVLYSIEMASVLVFWGFTDITLVTREFDMAIDRNKQTLGYDYCMEADMEQTGKNFDIIVGNPPYNGTLYHEFATKSVNMSKNGSFIIPAAFITGSTAADYNLRNTLLTGGLTSLTFKTMGTFVGVQKITVIVNWDRDSINSGVTIDRGFGTFMLPLKTNMDWWMIPYTPDMSPLMTHAPSLRMYQGRGKCPNADWVVALGEKVAFNQVGWNNRYNRPISGKVEVLQSNDVVAPSLKRFIPCKSQAQADCLSAYLKSDLFSILGSIASVEKNFTNIVFNRIPMIVSDEPFSLQLAATQLNIPFDLLNSILSTINPTK